MHFFFYVTILTVTSILSRSANLCEIKERSAVTCADGSFDKIIPSASRDEITSLELRNFNRSTLNLTEIVNSYPNLINLSVNGTGKAAVKTVIYDGRNDRLRELRLNNLGLRHMRESALLNLRSLNVLDLRNNSFEYLHKEKLAKLKNVTDIYLSGNKWNCSLSLDWIRMARHLPIRDISLVRCHDDPFDGRPLLFIADLKYNTRRTCTSNCSCSLTSVSRGRDTDDLLPMVEVNCTNRSMATFPAWLPKHTTKLILNQNAIGDVGPLIENPIYRDVTDLYLDHNKIDSIDLLEGTNWLENFRILSLRGNKLAEVPTYAIDNALERNPNMPNAVMLFLGENPWRCDCDFTPGFKDNILVKYAPHIQDLYSVKCAYNYGDENSLLPIMQLSTASICHVPSDISVKAVNFLNAVLASLIVLVLGKLAYDYYYFKKTGKLPWIVRKIP